MLHETLLQGQIFLSLFYFGLLAGIILSAKLLIDRILKSKWVVFITDIVFLVLSAVLFVLAENLFHYGEFRLFLLLAFTLGIVLEHLSIGFLVEKFFILAYNAIRSLLEKIIQKWKNRKRNHDGKTNLHPIQTD